MGPKEFLQNLFQESLDRCSPSRSVSEYIQLDKQTNQLTIHDQLFDVEDRPIFALAVGKAAVPMFKAVDRIVGDYLTGSMVITSDRSKLASCPADKVLVGSHPVPDENSLNAGRKAKQFLEHLPANAILITLISGGTSSLLCSPAEGISIHDLNHTFELLNNSGATIREINTVRKHCSQIKGGQLLNCLSPDISLVDLVISDVPGNDLSIIGSGPTTPDGSTFQDAYHILLENNLWNYIPESAHAHIEKGLTGETPETIKPGKDPLNFHKSYIISSAAKLAQKIAALAQEASIHCNVSDSAFNEDVQVVATQIAGQLNESSQKTSKSLIHIFYGESTVNVTGNGKGGRNQELALRGALEIKGMKDVTWLSAGTDGVDGPTDAAGAIVDGQTIAKAKERGLDPQKYLKDNDSYRFHQQMGTLLKTGPTGNNLMDVVLVLLNYG